MLSSIEFELFSRPLRAGDQVGRYKLLEQIGEGGCGVVFRAEQLEPIHRQVALKVIKLGMDTKQVVARFEAERQVLALMDHPNIARVLDGGATESARPYFVMDLVEGIRVTDYCDQNSLSSRKRLELFMQICRAIHHAHQRGIIHRDIKPSNVLVKLQDGLPVPKVIDFGIAKTTADQRLTDKTLFTAFEQFMGTPAYMSPEQAEMSGLEIDARSDVYSLGVLLYELLTGMTPFETSDLLKSGVEAMRRTIRETEPVRPSTRVRSMPERERTTTAKRRQIEPAQLFRLLRGDLDWIVMKALEKNRTRRYETAEALAMDIQRYLTHKPVMARPPHVIYRLKKLLRRRRLAFTAGLIITAVLVVGAGGATLLWLQSRRTFRSALTAEQGRERLRLEAKLTRVGAVALELRDQGRLVEAEIQFRELLAMQKKLQGNAHPAVAGALDDLGEVLRRQGKFDKAEVMFREALAMRRKLTGTGPSEMATSLDNLAAVLRSRGKDEEAAALYAEELDVLGKATDKDHPRIANTLSNLIDVLPGS